ncbi:hypothetical protein D3C79_1058200 [compost metagenome]
MCGARATPTISVKLNLGGQCRGYRIREDGTGAAEITDVWRMRHSYRIREVEPDALSTATTVSVKMHQTKP